MKKRKLPDFLLDQYTIGKKKAQKWLKNYPYKRLNLDHLLKQFKQTQNEQDDIFLIWKRIHWIINKALLTNIENSDIYKYCSIGISYMQTKLSLYEIQTKMEK